MNPAPELPLRDIHLPEGVPWWPPAPGWWLLLALLTALALFVVFLIRRRRQTMVRRLARRELARIEAAQQRNGDDQAMLQALSVLLRRLGITYLPRNAYAGLSGEAWYRELNRLSSAGGFDQDSIELLCRGPYAAQVTLQASQRSRLLEQCRQWIAALPPTTRSKNMGTARNA